MQHCGGALSGAHPNHFQPKRTDAPTTTEFAPDLSRNHRLIADATGTRQTDDLDNCEFDGWLNSTILPFHSSSNFQIVHDELSIGNRANEIANGNQRNEPGVRTLFERLG